MTRPPGQGLREKRRGGSAPSALPAPSPRLIPTTSLTRPFPGPPVSQAHLFPRHLSPRLTCAVGRRTELRARRPTGAGPPPGSAGPELCPGRSVPPCPRPPTSCAALQEAAALRPHQVGGQVGRARARRLLLRVPGGRGRRGAPQVPGCAACVTVPTWPAGAHVTCSRAASASESRLESPFWDRPPPFALHAHRLGPGVACQGDARATRLHPSATLHFSLRARLCCPLLQEALQEADQPSGESEVCKASTAPERAPPLQNGGQRAAQELWRTLAAFKVFALFPSPPFYR